MKKMNLLLMTCIFFLSLSCSKDEQPQKDNNPADLLKTKLNGLWIEIEPCDSCNTFQFTENDSIIQFNTSSKERLFASFEVISQDSIKVIRDWEIEESKRITFNKIFFLSNDTLEISQFLPVDYGLTEFENIKLYKTK